MDKDTKNVLIAFIVTFLLLVLAYKCKGQDSLLWVCESGIGITIEDQEYLTGHLVAGFVTLRNVQADSFKITVRDSVNIDIDCIFNDLDIIFYDCTNQVLSTIKPKNYMMYQIHHKEKGYLVKYDPSGSIWSEQHKAAYDFDDLDYAQKVHSKLPGSNIIEITTTN